jgi:hypothetical protein
MANFTLYQAVLGEIDPYSPSSLTIKKALADEGLNAIDEYVSAQHKIKIVKVAINVLKKLIVLSSDSMGKSSQGYKEKELKNRIKVLCNEAGLDSSDYVDVPSISDGSHLW